MLTTFRPVAQRLELTFWMIFIHLMSDSPIVQKVVIRSIKIIQLLRITIEDRLTVAVSILGLLIGLLFGILSSLL